MEYEAEFVVLYTDSGADEPNMEMEMYYTEPFKANDDEDAIGYLSVVADMLGSGEGFDDIFVIDPCIEDILLNYLKQGDRIISVTADQWK